MFTSAWAKLAWRTCVVVSVAGCAAGARPLPALDTTHETPPPFEAYRAPAASSGMAAGGGTQMGTGGAFGGSGAVGGVGASSGGDMSTTPSMPVTDCASAPNRALPYGISADFMVQNILSAGGLASVFVGCDDSLPLDVGGDPGDASACPLAIDAAAGDDAGDVDAAVADDAGAPDAGADGDAGNPPGVGPIGDSTSPLSCFAYRYDPTACVAANGGIPVCALSTCWSGVIFAPSGFDGPGVCIAPGAKRIIFKARASRENARVKFGAIRPGLGETEFFLTLTTSWRQYAITIPDDEAYDADPLTAQAGVWNGFSMVVEPEDHVGGTTILFGDVFWTM
ncbi:MAG TPA: hypothetical protein VHJ20_22610 [Polyangia bacterium]|nr:hypothetical protein [Polyangia bacterium]